MKRLVAKLVWSTDGQDLIEYGLLVGLITVGVVGLITTIGGAVLTMFQDLVDVLP